MAELLTGFQEFCRSVIQIFKAKNVSETPCGKPRGTLQRCSWVIEGIHFKRFVMPSQFNLGTAVNSGADLLIKLRAVCTVFLLIRRIFQHSMKMGVLLWTLRGIVERVHGNSKVCVYSFCENLHMWLPQYAFVVSRNRTDIQTARYNCPSIVPTHLEKPLSFGSVQYESSRVVFRSMILQPL
jgi:ribosomal protein L35AE/L33A